jgi:hypothetical protein
MKGRAESHTVRAGRGVNSCAASTFGLKYATHVMRGCIASEVLLWIVRLLLIRWKQVFAAQELWIVGASRPATRTA